MKIFDLINKLRLSATEGWSNVPFATGNNSCFYSDIIENHFLTLAWVAVRNNISDLELRRHHLIREKNDVNGISNSLPRLIIVTDGRKWFLSKQGDEQFTSVKFSSILINLYNELKAISILLTSCHSSELFKKKIKNSLEHLKLEIRNYGESIPEVKKQESTEVFTGTGQLKIDIKSDLLTYFTPVSKDEQLDRYSKILHKLLFRTLNQKQLQFLLKFPENNVLVHPFYKKGQLLICITRHFFKNELEAVHHNPTFLIMDKYTGTKSFHPSQNLLNNEILPNLLKVNIDLINEYLTKEPF